MPDSASLLSIGQVAERTGLSVHALRFYEREGVLVDPVRRGPAGRRVYSENDVEWLTVCIILRASGMPLPAIRRYTELVREGDGNEEERLALLRARHRPDRRPGPVPGPGEPQGRRLRGHPHRPGRPLPAGLERTLIQILARTTAVRPDRHA
ncbi:MerR family transcriptional regulator [Actinoallomurus sp. NPDC052274]|uniref:MerR family transcriptional regulator n=1 Tax=Actinoallomurus sp. NPDC052274 TaxID=3155420 RepID=UPI0034497616